MSLPARELGDAAGGALRAIIEGGNPADHQVMLTSRLILRDSTVRSP
ncbi:hypothetical protein [Streptomyces sp. NPDC057580]